MLWKISAATAMCVCEVNEFFSRKREEKKKEPKNLIIKKASLRMSKFSIEMEFTELHSYFISLFFSTG